MFLLVDRGLLGRPSCRFNGDLRQNEGCLKSTRPDMICYGAIVLLLLNAEERTRKETRILSLRAAPKLAGMLVGRHWVRKAAKSHRAARRVFPGIISRRSRLLGATKHAAVIIFVGTFIASGLAPEQYRLVMNCCAA